MSQAPQESRASGDRASRTVGAVLCWAAAIYLALVVAVTIFVAVSLWMTAGEPDANLVGVYLILVTLPLSLLFVALNEFTVGLTGTPMLFVLAGAGVIQAAGLWALGRRVGRDGKAST